MPCVYATMVKADSGATNKNNALDEINNKCKLFIFLYL